MVNRVIKCALDDEFIKYGRILEDLNPITLEKFMKDIPILDEITYVASSETLEALEIATYFEQVVFGEMPIQIGYASGHNTLLNAVEYHKSPEVLVAITDLLLILGKKEDITSDFTYNTELMDIFIVPAGIAIELNTDTLHYCPCEADKDGFKCVAIMTRGSNTKISDLHSKIGENQLLFAKNKWLIAHPHSELAKQGAFVGLKNLNISVK